MGLAQISERAAELSEKYEVPERLSNASRAIYGQMSAAGRAAQRGAAVAYRTALEYPRTSIAGVIVAATLVGGLLWWMFGDEGRPVQRRRVHSRVRAGSERRKKQRTARAAAH